MNIPTFRIGSAAAIAIDIAEVKVRGKDRKAFTGVIEAREALIDQQVAELIEPDQRALRLTEQALSMAMDAKIALGLTEVDAPLTDLQIAKQRLELAAALAIAALGALEGQD